VKAEDLRAFLTQRRVQFTERSIDYGTQFRCADGEVFSVYDSGKLVAGKKTPLALEVLEWHGSAGTAKVSEAPEEGGRRSGLDRRVFIVYGHDIGARDGLELVVRRMGMKPIVLATLPAGGETIIEKLERYLGTAGQIGFACVLLTPDDQGYPVGHAEDVRYRARQNVVLELGMVLARLGRARVAILHKASVDLPSDIAGLIYIPFTERVEEALPQLFKELENAGLRPDPAGL
jgi:predicted nucleotide-binding protein